MNAETGEQKVELKKSTLIQKVSCEDLFGRFNYSLDVTGHGNSPVFLYGDNGAGKTTILRLIYSLLANTMHEGCKNFIARVPFKRFEIEFVNNSRIGARR